MIDVRQYLSSGCLVHDYSEYSGISIDTVVDRIINFKTLNVEDFAEKGSHHDFYAHSKTYIYDLLSAHSDMEGPKTKINNFLPGVLDYIKEHPGKKFLELGGGIGDICQLMVEWGGKDVTYMDIDTHISQFAQWRFKKYNIPMTVKIIPQDSLTLTEEYDFIYQDAVLEHLTPEQQVSYTRELASRVTAGGVFVMIVDLAGEAEDMPMHFNVNIRSVHDTISAEGLHCHHGLYQFASVWTRPQQH